MHQIDSTFVKLEDDETCALLKPNQSQTAPVSHIVKEILNIFHQYPEVRKRVIARVGLAGYTIAE
jgi:hypothetical protein